MESHEKAELAFFVALSCDLERLNWERPDHGRAPALTLSGRTRWTGLIAAEGGRVNLASYAARERLELAILCRSRFCTVTTSIRSMADVGSANRTQPVGNDRFWKKQTFLPVLRNDRV
jgi:hypothetical protein